MMQVLRALRKKLIKLLMYLYIFVWTPLIYESLGTVTNHFIFHF